MQQPDGVPQHPRGGDLLQGDVLPANLGVRIQQRVLPVFERGQVTDVRRRVRSMDVLPAEGTEETSRPALPSGLKGKVLERRTGRLRLRLLLEADHEDPGVQPGGDEVHAHAGGHAAGIARRVRPEYGFAGRAERISEIQLRRHQPLQYVRGLAQHDGVYLVPVESRVDQSPLRRLAHQPAQRHVEPRRRVVGLADPDDRTAGLHRSITTSPTPSGRAGCAAGRVRWWRVPPLDGPHRA